MQCRNRMRFSSFADWSGCALVARFPLSIPFFQGMLPNFCPTHRTDRVPSFIRDLESSAVIAYRRVSRSRSVPCSAEPTGRAVEHADQREADRDQRPSINGVTRPFLSSSSNLGNLDDIPPYRRRISSHRARYLSDIGPRRRRDTNR